MHYVVQLLDRRQVVASSSALVQLLDTGQAAGGGRHLFVARQQRCAAAQPRSASDALQ